MPNFASTANFGSTNGGLGTIGYTIYNQDGTTKQSRTTTGIVELGTTTGIYRTVINYVPFFKGFVLWDTGGATPVYASESINPIDADPISDEVRGMFRSLNVSLSSYLQRQFEKKDIKPVMDLIGEDRNAELRRLIAEMSESLNKKLKNMNLSPQVTVNNDSVAKEIETLKSEVLKGLNSLENSIKVSQLDDTNKLKQEFNRFDEVVKQLDEIKNVIGNINIRPNVHVENKEILDSLMELKEDKKEVEAIQALRSEITDSANTFSSELTKSVEKGAKDIMEEHSKKLESMKKKLSEDIAKAEEQIRNYISVVGNEILSQDQKKTLKEQADMLHNQRMHFITGVSRG